MSVRSQYDDTGVSECLVIDINFRSHFEIDVLGKLL